MPLVRALSLLVVFLTAATTAAAQNLSSGWTSSDIGSPALAGSASYATGVFTIDAAGADIWGTSDQFHFVYQPVSGDVDVRARVDDLSYPHAWAKAGVMIRGALTANAAHAFALASAGRGLAFQRRREPGATSVHTAGEAAVPPRWVRLVRQGARITAMTSEDGGAWTTVGTDTISLGAVAYVGIAVTSHNVSVRATARIAEVAVTPLSAALPQGQSSADVGAPMIAGSASFADSAYTITAGGSDVWGTSDQFHFVYQPLAGDGEVIARVRSLGYTHAWAKAGVMIRESLAPNARHGFALVSAANGVAFQRRPEPGSLSEHTTGGAGVAPVWVRLVREGTAFTAYRSPDGETWTMVATDTINMAATTVYVGIAVVSHNSSAATTAVVDGFRVLTGGTGNQVPVVSLSSPADGARFTAPATIALTAEATDPEGRLAAVEFYNGATLLARDTTAPYAYTWTGVAQGSYSVFAVATDADGGSATSVAASVTVAAPANQPPTVSLTAPADGTRYTAPATIAISATASDPEGRLARVDFFSGSTLLGSDTASPYAFSWGGVTAGTYTLTAIARDAEGATTASGTVTVTVETAQSPPPRAVAFTASADHATTALTNYVLEIFASGANPATATPVATSDLGKPTPDANGEITVDRSTFFGALAPGSYVAAVRADGPGGSSRSAPVTFTR